jgi:hypothetical protein
MGRRIYFYHSATLALLTRLLTNATRSCGGCSYADIIFSCHPEKSGAATSDYGVLSQPKLPLALPGRLRPGAAAIPHTRRLIPSLRRRAQPSRTHSRGKMHAPGTGQAGPARRAEAPRNDAAVRERPVRAVFRRPAPAARRRLRRKTSLSLRHQERPSTETYPR